MTRLEITWAFTALFLQYVSGASEVTPFLVGGTPAAIGAFPAQVGINIGQQAFCGGTILNQNHVLTAGSCVLNDQNNLLASTQFLVRSGIINIDATTPSQQIDRVFVHPQYNPFTFENDIAVLRIVGSFVFPETGQPHIAPVEMIDRIVPENSGCQVVGWNWTPGVQTMALQQLAVSVYERAACNSMHPSMIRDSMICVTGTTQAQGLCVSNRGGGLYCDGRMAGVASFGFGCGQNTTATVYTQIRFHQQWIQQQFARTDNPQAGPTPMPGFDGSSSMIKASVVAMLITSLVVALYR
ncbi:trypsin-like isoform X2 [Uranotaenia lowii]|uniref:trypsin-like isoform X2 n=1 Tax=Uranotaenia lowii TaxID=190385 RepID=UPI00247A841A|nr:trypsin-like isoform X2 [Uranotaenia lowii]